MLSHERGDTEGIGKHEVTIASTTTSERAVEKLESQSSAVITPIGSVVALENATTARDDQASMPTIAAMTR